MATLREPRRTDLNSPPTGFEWVTCNPRDYGSAGFSIHLIYSETRKQHWQTVVCGATASGPGIWRRPAWNSTKPRCGLCAEKEKDL